MIASLSGNLKQKAPEGLIVDVGGVGYKVSVSLQTLSRLPPPGSPVSLLIFTAVREDDISLFGFLEESEKKMFQRLISVSGIGPKLALVVLSGIPPRDLVEALVREDLVRLTAISGIGKKTAERMIVDLKDKLVDILGIEETGGTARPPQGRVFEDAISALVNLGYPRSSAERTLTKISIKTGSSVEGVLRDALKILADAR